MTVAAWLFVVGLVGLTLWAGMGPPTTPWLSLVLLAMSVPAFVWAMAVRRGKVRWTLAILGIFVAVSIDYVMLGWSAFPQYAGNVTLGAPVPSFAAVDRAGRAWSSSSLDGRRTLLVFFRGKW